MLHIGGEAGLKVLAPRLGPPQKAWTKGDALEPGSAAPVKLCKVAKAIEASRDEEEKKEAKEESEASRGKWIRFMIDISYSSRYSTV